jgi:hypothetical protein
MEEETQDDDTYRRWIPAVDIQEGELEALPNITKILTDLLNGGYSRVCDFIADLDAFIDDDIELFYDPLILLRGQTNEQTPCVAIQADALIEAAQKRGFDGLTVIEKVSELFHDFGYNITRHTYEELYGIIHPNTNNAWRRCDKWTVFSHDK